jgi:hypothetical protein
MVELVDLQAAAYVAQIIGVIGTLTAAFIAVRSYVNANKRAEEAKRKEQETREMELKTQRQNLETRQAQMFMNIYSQTTTKDFTAAWNMFTSANWKNYEEYKKIIKDKEFVDKFTIIGMFYEGLGVLVRKGYLDIELVAFLLCGMTRYFWEKLIPIKDEYRAEAGYSRWFSELEYLYTELMKYLEAHPELDTRINNPNLTQ